MPERARIHTFIVMYIISVLQKKRQSRLLFISLNWIGLLCVRSLSLSLSFLVVHKIKQMKPNVLNNKNYLLFLALSLFGMNQYTIFGLFVFVIFVAYLIAAPKFGERMSVLLFVVGFC